MRTVGFMTHAFEHHDVNVRFKRKSDHKRNVAFISRSSLLSTGECTFATKRLKLMHAIIRNNVTLSDQVVALKCLCITESKACLLQITNIVVVEGDIVTQK